ncbi:unnamed protein product [Brachionus calyciflorus]|uniref:Uncharacterized protein n=1 Tax=Brachionus calyciflorus TaxID=104777 RepID=A0A813X2S3_9BILA|nr:unnamed protein product [Brachionus calyciflorus]
MIHEDESVRDWEKERIEVEINRRLRVKIIEEKKKQWNLFDDGNVAQNLEVNLRTQTNYEKRGTELFREPEERSSFNESFRLSENLIVQKTPELLNLELELKYPRKNYEVLAISEGFNEIISIYERIKELKRCLAIENPLSIQLTANNKPNELNKSLNFMLFLNEMLKKGLNNILIKSEDSDTKGFILLG